MTRALRGTDPAASFAEVIGRALRPRQGQQGQGDEGEDEQEEEGAAGHAGLARKGGADC